LSPSKTPPELTVRAPAVALVALQMLPVPAMRRVPPETVTLPETVLAPVRLSVPALTAMLPVKVLMPLRVRVPLPTLAMAMVPALLEITPENVVEVLSAPMVSRRVPGVMAETEPAPERDPMAAAPVLRERRPVAVTAVPAGMTVSPLSWRVAPELMTMDPTKSFVLLSSVVREPEMVRVPTLPEILPV
jgi:hypothetical protein